MSDDDDETETAVDGGSPGAPGDSPAVLGTASRLDVRTTRAAYRVGRRRYQPRARYRRSDRQLPIETLIGRVIERHGLTSPMREQCLAIAWRDIVGERFAKHTVPGSCAEGVLTVWTTHPIWSQELRYSSATLVEAINRWIAARQAWLGTHPFVTTLRTIFGAPRNPLADPGDVRALQRRYRRRPHTATSLPPPPTDADRQAILAETRVVDDADLRATIEWLRTTWNR